MKEMHDINRMKLDIRIIVYVILLTGVIAVATYSLTIGSIQWYHYMFFLAGSLFFIGWNVMTRIRLVKSNLNSLLHQATEAEKAENWQEAVNAYDQALKASSGNIQALLGKARCTRLMGGYKSAIPLVKGILDKYPDSSDAHFLLGVCYKDGRYTDEAIETFEKSLQLNPHQTEAYMHLGDLYKINKNYDRAVLNYEKFLETDKNENYRKEVEEKLGKLKK